ncbi:MAG: protein kinase [Planctomycetia bacterium]|nr:protein kinase [Planctomycetia bacterium]
MNHDKIESLLDIRDDLGPADLSNADHFLEVYAVGDLQLSEEERCAFLHDWNMLNRVEKHLAGESPAGTKSSQLLGNYWDAKTCVKTPCLLSLNLTPGEEIIPGYTLISRIGGGGSGEVWLGKGPGDVHVAMKFISPENSTINQNDLDSRDEAMEIIRKVRYPHLLPIHGIWNNQEYRVIISSLADETLWDRFRATCKEGQPGIRIPVLLLWFRDIAKTLDFLNQPRGSSTEDSMPILHGDIKPENIFLSGNSILVGDLGQARILKQEGQSHSGGLTFLYAVPEYLKGHMHKNSDQYSLAVTWCVLRGGGFPCKGNLYEIIHQQEKNDPNLSFFPLKERNVLRKALSSIPNRRYSTCGEFAAALEETFLPKKRFGLGFLSVLIASLIVFFSLVYWQFPFDSLENTSRVQAKNESITDIFLSSGKEPKYDQKIVLSSRNKNFTREGLEKAISTAIRSKGNVQIILQTDKDNNRIPFDKEIAIEFMPNTRGIIIEGKGPQKPILDAGKKSRHFSFKQGSFLIRNLSLQNGKSSEDGGSILCGTNHKDHGNKKCPVR